MELSRTDLQILELLQEDASLSSQQIADRINLSQSPCWRCINRLEKAGLIDRRVAILDREGLGMEVVVFATVNLSDHGQENLVEFEREVDVFPEVLECYTMTGAWDYMLKVVTKGHPSLRAVHPRETDAAAAHWRGPLAHRRHRDQEHDASAARHAALTRSPTW